MIQRIQTLYLIGCIAFLAIASFGFNFFQISGVENYSFNVFGTYKMSDGSRLVDFPLYLVSVVLIAAFTVAIFLFKNLKKQFRLVKIAGFIYSFYLVGLAVYYFQFPGIEGETKSVVYLSSGFYLLFAGFSFVLLAQKSIKKDIQLLDSLNRLR